MASWHRGLTLSVSLVVYLLRMQGIQSDLAFHGTLPLERSFFSCKTNNVKLILTCLALHLKTLHLGPDSVHLLTNAPPHVAHELLSTPYPDVAVNLNFDKVISSTA